MNGVGTSGTEHSVPAVDITSLDGLAVVAPTEPLATDPEVIASLVFRVGLADEPVVLRGITHLVEHVVLSQFDPDGALAFNGSVGMTETSFVAQGTRAAVQEWLSALMQRLVDVPVSRLAHERRVLQIEGQTFQPGMVDASMLLRYGLRGPGRSVVPEWALHWADAEQVLAWAAEWFTAANAVLWANAPLEDVRMVLPPGHHRPPRLPSSLVSTPCIEARATTSVLMSSVVQRSTANSSAARHAHRRLVRSLRHEHGVSYSPGGSYLPLTSDEALVVLAADTSSEHARDAARELLRVLEVLASDGPDATEIARDAEQSVDMLGTAGSGWVARVARGVLLGEDDPADTSFLDELRDLAPGDVAAAAAEIVDQALVVVPDEAADLAHHRPYSRYRPRPAPAIVGGRAARFRYAPPMDAFRVTYDDGGVTAYDESGSPTTVRFSHCAGVVAWPDGSRLLYGMDGSRLFLDATEWRGYGGLRACVDEHAPTPFAVVDEVPVRDPQWRRKAIWWGIKRGGARIVGAGALLLAAAAWLASTLLNPTSDAGTRGGPAAPEVARAACEQAATHLDGTDRGARLAAIALHLGNSAGQAPSSDYWAAVVAHCRDVVEGTGDASLQQIVREVADDGT